ncbi:MAG: 50S ribosomal protein L23 [Methylococcaceae bacterium]
MSSNLYQLTRILEVPVISEKSTIVAEKDKQIVFRVLRNASKKQVKNAVEAMFNVEVDAVRVLNVKGKQKRFGQSLGKRSDWKKAYVKLKVGYDIEFATA